VFIVLIPRLGNVTTAAFAASQKEQINDQSSNRDAERLTLGNPATGPYLFECLGPYQKRVHVDILPYPRKDTGQKMNKSYSDIGGQRGMVNRDWVPKTHAPWPSKAPERPKMRSPPMPPVSLP